VTRFFCGKQMLLASTTLKQQQAAMLPVIDDRERTLEVRRSEGWTVKQSLKREEYFGRLSGA
jgi:hypothetical protein